MRSIDQVTHSVTAFRTYAELTRACEGGYVPTIQVFSDDSAEEKGGKQLLINYLTADGFKIFDGKIPTGVHATSYGRTDGKVTAVKVHDGEWVLRCVRGPAWFWNFDTREWTICTTLDMNSKSFTKHYIRTEQEVLALLPTLEPQ